MNNAKGCSPRSILEVGEVFVAGGMPTITYNPRSQLNLEGQLRDAIKRLNKIILVVGATKSGKTVLVRRVLPLDEAIWVEGGAIREEGDFWQEIVNQLGISLETSTTIGESAENGTQNEGSAGIKPFGIGAEGKRTASSKDSTTRQDGFKRVETARSASLRVLKERKLTLVVDDFHYMTRELQSSIVRALKQPVFDRLKVVLLAVPHRVADAVKAESEIEGRVASVAVPDWHNPELVDIANSGFDALNVDVDAVEVQHLVDGAFSSPHLLQDLCSLLCKLGNVEETVQSSVALTPPKPLDILFKELASHMQPTAFSRIKKGPDRTNRLERALRNGSGSCDIYEAVLYSIIETGPASVVTYNELSAKIKEVLQPSAVPQQHEVTRVLEQMAKLAAEVGGAVPPLDYDKDLKVMHITDPFFRFYLKWGVERTWA
ncbi:ATP-binding protein [Caballeronia novacaledonica]|uniref:Uncharacterized protein n=1 Tax=Caballeronia novacaledonica TaxID=1544861 RepID=A0AA37MIN1_9BURK|nr:ATP-binding protein [Caballeronia novacaledonica]GJH28800.1 hypothetical protein CBA19CS42_29810 [Caballeronia novacaledonica]